MLLNEESAALIKRFAALSGHGLIVAPRVRRRHHKEFLLEKFAKELGNKTDVKNLKRFLKDAPVETILNLGWNNCGTLWGITIESM